MCESQNIKTFRSLSMVLYLTKTKVFASGQYWLQLSFYDIIVRLYTSCIRIFCLQLLSNQKNTSLSGGNLVIWLDNNQNVAYLTLGFHPVLKNTSLPGCNTDQLVVLWLYDVFSTRKPVYTEKIKSLKHVPNLVCWVLLNKECFAGAMYGRQIQLIEPAQTVCIFLY